MPAGTQTCHCVHWTTEPQADETTVLQRCVCFGSFKDSKEDLGKWWGQKVSRSSECLSQTTHPVLSALFSPHVKTCLAVALSKLTRGCGCGCRLDGDENSQFSIWRLPTIKETETHDAHAFNNTHEMGFVGLQIHYAPQQKHNSLMGKCDGNFCDLVRAESSAMRTDSAYL